MLQTVIDPAEILVTVEDRANMDHRLNAAVSSLQELAAASRAGILVTRKDPGTFTVTVNQHVPFGLIRELDEA